MNEIKGWPWLECATCSEHFQVHPQDQPYWVNCYACDSDDESGYGFTEDTYTNRTGR